ncbi:MAG: UDP-glucose/GDP-mannose dehydrogenase family protein [Desulforudis sp.]|jgi:UDPglucose 6-dehydrogenase|nr:MAG: UDP-glucose/GDP-mannose dehydrogenase family protein [Desulforudis sp.]
MRITVVGLGYVGAVAAAALAHSGYNVVGVDADWERVSAFRQGSCPFYEPKLPELLSSGLAAGRLRFHHPEEMTTPLGEVILVAVGTPSRSYGGTDLSQVRAAIRWVPQYEPGSAVLVMKSTVPPGTGLRLVAEELVNSGLRYVANPEFLREGQAVYDWFHPGRIVIGGENEEAITLVKKMYTGIEAPLLITDITSAETIKYAANAFLATKISFVNEMASLCERVGANIDDIARGIGLDPRIGQSFLRAGLGYGGSCFPKDIRALDFCSAVKGYNFELLRAVINVNNRQRLLPLQALHAAFGTIKGVKVALLGVAFKPHTDDSREAPALDIARLLVEDGAEVRAYDPQAMENARSLLPEKVVLCESALEALRGTQAVVLVTEWPEFCELPWEQVSRVLVPPRLIFDGRNALDGRELMRLGFYYRGVGRSGPRWEQRHQENNQ